MLKMLSYLLKKGTSTCSSVPKQLDATANGLPKVTTADCSTDCDACTMLCPTDAIVRDGNRLSVSVDRGACIGCNLCIDACETGTLERDASADVWAYDRSSLICKATKVDDLETKNQISGAPVFKNSLALRVVSTGCSACDLELSAASNPIFDMERFGIHVVASPRFADALVITGPVPKAMHQALESCYNAMAEPKLVIALGTCATSGGVHSHGYTSATGASAILPVDVFIPGCPPHPWQIINGLLAAKRIKRERTNNIA